MTAKVLVLNGPNLNLLGEREPEIYGRATLADIGRAVRAYAKTLDLAVDFRQSNHEGVLLDWIHAARKTHRAIIINPAGLTSTSISLMDALLGCGCRSSRCISPTSIGARPSAITPMSRARP